MSKNLNVLQIANEQSNLRNQEQDSLVGGFSGLFGEGASPLLQQFVPEEEEASAGEIFKAYVGDNNSVANAVNYFKNPVGEFDPDYNFYQDIEGTKYDQARYLDSFTGVQNANHMQQIKTRIDREEENEKILNGSGVKGLAIGFGAELLDPVNYIGVGALFKAYRMGKFAKGALIGGGGALVSTTAQEGILQATQETRTAEESLINIGGSMVLGSILGGAVTALSKTNFEKLTTRFEKDLEIREKEIPDNIPLKEGDLSEFGFKNDDLSTGARFNFAGSFEARMKEFGVKDPKVILAVKKLNPMLKIWGDPIPASKEVMLKMVRTNLETEGSAQGFAKPQSAEAELTRYNNNLASSLQATKETFKKVSSQRGEGIKARFGKGYKAFKEEVFDAIVTGESQNPEIQKLADTWRKNVFQAIGKEANDVGLFSRDIDIEANPNYLTRLYNTNKIIAQEREFKKLISDKAIERLIPRIKRAYTQKENTLFTQINDILAKEAELENLLDKAKTEKLDEARQGTTFSDDELNSILDRYKEAKRIVRTLKPKSLFQFIKENGGMQDSGGELASRDIAKRSVGLVRKDRYQFKVINSPEGPQRQSIDISLDAVAQRAWEHGYFPEFNERPSVNDLLEKIDQEAFGNKVYSELDLDQLEQIRYANEFFEEIDQLGIDINKIEEAKKIGKSGGTTKTKTTKKKTDPITEEITTKETTSKIANSLIGKEKEYLKAKKQRLDKRREKLKEEYDEIFGKGRDEIIKFNDGTTKTAGRLQEEAFAKEVADSIFDKIRGLENSKILPYDLKASVRGPAKERTLNFVETMELKPFLETDIERIGNKYVRSLGADIQLKKRFSDLNLSEEFAQINKEYNFLRDKATTEKERIKLAEQEEETIKILESFRDLLRGNYRSTRDPKSSIVKGFQNIRALNYMTKMGGVVLSSFPDTANLVIKHGFGRVFGTQLKRLTTSKEFGKLAKQDAQEMGQLWELVTSNRAMGMFDIADPYNSKSAFSKFIDASTETFSTLNLMNVWNNYMKDGAGLITSQRVIKGALNFDKLDAKEKRWLANFGIDAQNIDLLKAELKNVKSEKGLYTPDLKQWKNQEAKNLYMNAVNASIDSTIVTKGIGDVPMWMNSEIGKTIGQFKSFAFAAHQQIFLSGIQQRDMAVLSGMVSAITMGMLVYYLKELASGRQPSDDTGVWIAEGIDRSGLVPMIMEFNGLAEVFGLGIGNALGEERLSRFQTRNKIGAIAGPTFGTIQDALQIGGALSQGEITEGDARVIRRNIIGQNLFYTRKLFDLLEDNLQN